MTRGPVRKIGRGNRGNRGRIPADKAGGRATHESTLERDFYLCLEFDPAVAAFHPQPVEITYRDEEGRKRRSFPDTLVEYQGDRPPCLFEVKYVDELRKHAAKYRLKFQAARAYAREQGWTFCTATELSIRTPLLFNATFLLPYLDPTRVFPESAQRLLLDRLSAQGEAQPTTLLADLSPTERGEMLPVLWHLIARRRIMAKLDTPLNMQTVLRPGGQE